MQPTLLRLTRLVLAPLTLAAASLLVAADAPPPAAPAGITTAATMECLSVYCAAPAGDAGPCTVRYRESGAERWREGHPLVYAEADREYRGSLVGLKPDTRYEIEVQRGGTTVRTEARTRSEVFPVGKTTFLEPGEVFDPLVITESGTPDGYHLVTPRPGGATKINVANLSDHCVVVDADYVIVRGMVLENAGTDGLRIKAGRHDVVVEDNRICWWGRIGGAAGNGNPDLGAHEGGILAEKGSGRLVLQRNRIEMPRGSSNSWEFSHPLGPNGIFLMDSSGGNVIRYNELVGRSDHAFNDGIGGGRNFTYEGSPGRDSDIHGNIVEWVWDDGIESDGGNLNVRIWGNYLNHVRTFVSTAPVSKGPVYIFRNVFGESADSIEDPIGGTMFKESVRWERINGKNVLFGGGRRFIFHNTALQPRGAFSVFHAKVPPQNTVTRNNILWCRGPQYPEGPAAVPNDLQNDLLASTAFLPSYALEFYLAPTVRVPLYAGAKEIKRSGKEPRSIYEALVDLPNPAIGSGVHIPGFNQEEGGRAPDMGAFQTGAPPLRFGRAGLPGALAPWEQFPFEARAAAASGPVGGDPIGSWSLLLPSAGTDFPSGVVPLIFTFREEAGKLTGQYRLRGNYIGGAEFPLRDVRYEDGTLTFSFQLWQGSIEAKAILTVHGTGFRGTFISSQGTAAVSGQKN